MVCQCRKAVSRQSSKICGSCFFFDMAATTFSSSPGGRASDSISVMKPCRYFWARRASTSWGLLDTRGSSWRCVAVRALFAVRALKMGTVFRYSPLSHLRRHANFRRQVGDPQGGGVQSRQLPEGYLLQRTADGGVHPLPRAPDAALALDSALARGAAAFGDGNRPLEHV